MKFYGQLLLIILLSLSKQDNTMPRHYYAKNFALIKLYSENNRLTGSIFWINRKDSTQIIGTQKNNTLEFRSFLNGVDEGYFSYSGFMKNNQLKVIRTELHGNLTDTLLFAAVSKKEHDAILQQTLAPPQLKNLKKDTIIESYKFELLVENWNPETYYGNTTLIIIDKNTNRILQTIKSQNFHFNEYLSFGFTDMNFDNVKDLVFFNGYNGGYGTQTFDYYIYNKNNFVLNEQLSEIAGCMGIEVDTVNKRIISYCKSGCCWHEQKAFIVENNKFVEVKSLEIDEGFKNQIVIKNKINGKWKIETIPLNGELNQQMIDSLYSSF